MRKGFQTPGGSLIYLECREGTNDAMVAESVIEHDEYVMDALPRAGGRYIDIGAHIGSWIIAALTDDPYGEGVAVEPVPENVEVLRQNLDENGLTDRVEVLEGAFAKRGPVEIHYAFEPTDTKDESRARMHRYIGNQRMRDVTHSTIKVPAITPGKLFRDGAQAVKIDIEGGEVALVGARLGKVDNIAGEYHVDRGPLYEHLSKTHRVNFAGNQSFGTFAAVLR